MDWMTGESARADVVNVNAAKTASAASPDSRHREVSVFMVSDFRLVGNESQQRGAGDAPAQMLDLLTEVLS
jgi:hypothetical protein